MARSSGQDDDGLISGINVTPLVDVTLVLLIIFMVTAKIIHSSGMPMDLPKGVTGETIQTVFSVELFADGKTRVDSEVVPNDDAVGALAKTARLKNKDVRAVVKADKKVDWGRVIHVLDLLRKEKVVKIAFAMSPALNGEKGLPIEPVPLK